MNFIAAVDGSVKIYSKMILEYSFTDKQTGVNYVADSHGWELEKELVGERKKVYQEALSYVRVYARDEYIYKVEVSGTQGKTLHTRYYVKNLTRDLVELPEVVDKILSVYVPDPSTVTIRRMGLRDSEGIYPNEENMQNYIDAPSNWHMLDGNLQKFNSGKFKTKAEMEQFLDKFKLHSQRDSLYKIEIEDSGGKRTLYFSKHRNSKMKYYYPSDVARYLVFYRIGYNSK